MGPHSWFWTALAAWCLLGAASAWALFFPADLGGSQAIAQFTAQVNGLEEKNEVSQGLGTLESSLEAVTKKWEAEGWHRLSKGLDLAPVLLGISGKDGKGLSSFLQIQAFEDKRKGSLRLLGMVRDFGSQGTYQWTAEIPRAALHPADPSRVDFPLRPPAPAVNLLSLATEKVRILAWEGPPRLDPEGYFGRIFASQGFEGRILSKNDRGSVLLLQRGSTKLMAILGNDGGKTTVSLVQLRDMGYGSI